MENINEILSLDKHAETKHLKKVTPLQREGITSSFAFYVKKELLRSYAINEKGKEYVFMFAPKGSITADFESQEFDLHTGLFIDCIKESEALTFNRFFFVSYFEQSKITEKCPING